MNATFIPRPSCCFRIMVSMALGGIFLAKDLPAQTGWKWSRMESGALTTLNAISMADDSFGVAVGDDSTVVRYADGRWQKVGGEIVDANKGENSFPGVAGSGGWGPDAKFEAVNAVDANMVWLGSHGPEREQRGVAFWNGSSWSARSENPVGRVLCLWSDEAGTILAGGGAPGRIARFDGKKWKTAVEYSAGFYRGIHGRPGASIWAVGFVWEEKGGEKSPRNIISSLDGGATWGPNPVIQETEAASKAWNAVFSLDDNHVWMVGDKGAIGFWDGSSMTVLKAEAGDGSDQDLHAVCALDASNVWAVGNAGTILYFNGTAWAPVDAGFSIDGDLRDIVMDNQGGLWSVGGNGVVLHAKPAAR